MKRRQHSVTKRLFRVQDADAACLMFSRLSPRRCIFSAWGSIYFAFTPSRCAISSRLHTRLICPQCRHRIRISAPDGKFLRDANALSFRRQRRSYFSPSSAPLADVTPPQYVDSRSSFCSMPRHRQCRLPCCWLMLRLMMRGCIARGGRAAAARARLAMLLMQNSSHGK